MHTRTGKCLLVDELLDDIATKMRGIWPSLMVGKMGKNGAPKHTKGRRRMLRRGLQPQLQVHLMRIARLNLFVCVAELARHASKHDHQHLCSWMDRNNDFLRSLAEILFPLITGFHYDFIFELLFPIFQAFIVPHHHRSWTSAIVRNYHQVVSTFIICTTIQQSSK